MPSESPMLVTGAQPFGLSLLVFQSYDQAGEAELVKLGFKLVYL